MPICHWTDQRGNVTPPRSAEIVFFCPACECAHGVLLSAPGDWTFNGDLERPTFSPSIKVTSTELTVEALTMIERGEKPVPTPDGKIIYPTRETVCHSHVTDGRIQYLADCTHALAGQTIDLPQF